VRNRTPARVLAIAGATTVVALLAPAPVAAKQDEGKGGKRPRPVVWLPAPDDPDPMRGRTMHTELQREVHRIEVAAAHAGVHPIAGDHDYGEAQARFGVARPGHTHAGQDVFAPDGTPLVAVREGIVLETGNDGGRGNYIGIYSPAARQTYVYLHMNAPARVKQGNRVRAGQRIGAVGCTGSCYGTHLHFEVREGRSLQEHPIDPLPMLQKLERAQPV
jgi:murein DD-endopeptidase MepM/ murein hydrolase activator NlpD